MRYFAAQFIRRRAMRQTERKQPYAQQDCQSPRGEIFQYATQALLRLEQRILQRPVYIGQVGLGPSIIFIAFQHRRAQVQLRQHVAQAGRNPFAPLELATEHEHRHIGHHGKGRRQARECTVVQGQYRRAGIGNGRQPPRPYQSPLAMLPNTKPTWPKNAWSKSCRALRWSVSLTAAISLSTYGWARMAPWPKMIRLRVSMLAPSTVMAMGICW